MHFLENVNHMGIHQVSECIAYVLVNSIACAIWSQSGNVKLYESFRAVTWLTVYRAQQVWSTGKTGFKWRKKMDCSDKHYYSK